MTSCRVSRSGTRLATLALVILVMMVPAAGGCPSILGISQPGSEGGNRIEPTSGDGQSGVAGAPLSAPFVVTVEDANQEPVRGLAVNFVVTAGGGIVSAPSVMTDQLGHAQTTLTLGTTAGENRVEAQVPGLAGSPVLFTATGVAGPAVEIVQVSGDAQSGPAGRVLPEMLTVAIQDANGNPVSGTMVSFVITGGDGSVMVPNPMSDVLGQASAILTVGVTPGVNTVEARAPSLAGSPVLFSATGRPATQIVLLAGDRQLGTPGATLAAPLVVQVLDSTSMPVVGVPVDFVVTGGGGQVSTGSALSDATGHAQTMFTLGAAAGVNKVEARAPSLSGSPVVFSATMLGPGVSLPSNVTRSIAFGDLDGDGLVDLCQTGPSSQVAVFPSTTAAGATTPSFAPEIDFPAGMGIGSVAIGDLNGDGRPDLAFAELMNSFVAVSLNTTPVGAAAPTFAAPVQFALGPLSPGGPGQVAIGDLNGDGKPDLVLPNKTASVVSVLRNTTAAGAGTPTFAAKVDFPVGPSPIAVAIGDLNADGRLDLAVIPDLSPAVVEVLLNTTALVSMPSFAGKVAFPVSPSPTAVAIDDLDGDGKPDLAVAVNNGNVVAVLRNLTTAGATTPSFAGKVDFPVGMLPSSIAVGDLNGDGKPDLATSNEADGSVSILASTSVSGAPPSFAARVDLTFAAGVPRFVGIGDLNADGRADLVVWAGPTPTGNTIVLLAH